MATVGSLIVKIGANIRNFVQGMNQAKDTMKQTADSVSASADQMAQNTQQATTKTGRAMTAAAQQAKQLRDAMKAAEQAVRQDFEKLSASAGQFAGRNDEFMKSLEQLGLKQKKITDEMMKNNEAMKVSFFQTTAAIMARTNSATKTLEQIKRVGNPIRALDPVFLGLANRLETMAKNGQAAVVALRELGPNANMKELADLTRLIQQRLGGIQQLQIGAGIVTLAEIILLVKLANAVDQTLVPAFEEFKRVWFEALKPFGQMMANVFKAILKVSTAVGEFFVNLNKINPVITQIIFGFMALLPPLLLLLAPLAIGISAAGSFAAAFGALWTVIGPVVTAFLAVIGTVMVVAALIVGLIALWNQLWNASETLRTAVSNAWDAIKAAILGALAPLAPAWETLKKAFTDMIATFVGAEPNATAIWRKMGDAVGEFINWLVPILVPTIEAVVSTIVTVLTTMMNVVATVFSTIAWVWETDFLFIRTLVVTTFEAIKNVISSGLDIIKNVFLLVTNVIKGNWSAAWENIKNIFFSTLEFIWNYLQVWGVGKVLKFFTVWANELWTVIKTTWDRIKLWTETTWGGIHTYLIGIWNGLKTTLTMVWTTLKTTTETTWNAVKTFLTNTWTAIKTLFTTSFNTVKTTVVSGLTNIKSNFTSYLTDTLNNVKSFTSGFIDAGKDFVMGLWDGIKSKTGWLWKQVKGWLDDLISKITGALSSGGKSSGNNTGDSTMTGAGGGGGSAGGGGGGAPGLATGGTVKRSGLTWVGERGPELLNLPRGAQVTSNRDSMDLLGTQAPQINLEINLNGPVYGLDDLKRQIKEVIASDALPILTKQLRQPARARG